MLFSSPCGSNMVWTVVFINVKLREVMIQISALDHWLTIPELPLLDNRGDWSYWDCWELLRLLRIVENCWEIVENCWVELLFWLMEADAFVWRVSVQDEVHICFYWRQFITVMVVKRHCFSQDCFHLTWTFTRISTISANLNNSGNCWIWVMEKHEFLIIRSQSVQCWTRNAEIRKVFETYSECNC